MLTRESKLKLLENFYAIDLALFGKPATKVDICCPVFIEEFLSLKGALLSIVIEMYKLMEHDPKPIMESVSKKDLMKSAIKSAKAARAESKRLVSSKEGKESVKIRLREALHTSDEKVNIDKMVQETIRRKAFSLAVDNLLIGRTISEAKSYKKLNSWDGKIMEDAYKVLRDQLVDSALTIMES